MVNIVLSTISLGIQMVVLGLLTSGYLFKRRGNYRYHGLFMLSAVSFHIVAILVIMVPSLGALFSDPSAVNFADALIIATLIHVSAGLLAALLGIWLVSSWHLQSNLETCFKKKRFMDATISLWLLAIALGVILYLVLIQAL